MNAKSITVLVLAAVLAVGGFMFYRDYEFRQTHGQVTEVGLFNYDQEVEKANGTVLIYFYRQENGSADPAVEAQTKVVRSFAWSTAGDVKVVEVNTAHLENLPLAIAHGAVRSPAFVFIKGDKVVSGSAGVNVSKEELNRLLEMVNHAK